MTKSKSVYIDVYSGQAFRITEIASWFASLRNKDIILILHGGALPDFFFSKSKRVRTTLERANIILTPSLYLKDFFEKYDFSIQYLPNSVDLNMFPFVRRANPRFSLLWVRAFSKVYNPHIAVQVLSIVRKKYPAATLTMVGPDKGNLARIKSLISELNIENAVNITGPIPNKELYKYYQSHEVYINTTAYESFGVAVVEAAACGIPIVSSKVGEIPYLWTHEKNILLVDDYEPSSFADEVIRVFEDEKLASRISLDAYKNAQSFDWERIKPLWINLLSGLNKA